MCPDAGSRPTRCGGGRGHGWSDDAPGRSVRDVATDTVWVLGDQLDERLGHLADRDPAMTTVLMVVSRSKLASRRWGRQRAHFYIASMMRFAERLRSLGFTVDWRVAASMRAGLEGHLADHQPSEVVAMEPANRSGVALLERLGVRLVPSDQFLCHRDEFRAWADEHRRRDGSLLMEDFYRWQRRRLDILIEPDGSPVGGTWNLDQENRLPPPADGGDWPEAPLDPADEVDREVSSLLDGLDLTGGPWTGIWATDRAGALRRLEHFIDAALPGFGPYEDAVVSHHRHLNHSMLSPYLNNGLLHPAEVVEAVVEAHRRGGIPLNSAEGVIRQIIGWREYIAGLYWWHDADYIESNHFDNTLDVPPALLGGPTDMNCVSHVARWVAEDGWTHHIPRLMVIANLATLAGVQPRALVDWMWESFVDGAEWVMVPNVIGMGMYADGGTMSTKPYISGGNYLSKMTDFCSGCAFDRRRRVGADACPFTTLYWDFLDRHRDLLAGNHRLGRVYANLGRLDDLGAVRERAVEVRSRLAAGTL